MKSSLKLGFLGVISLAVFCLSGCKKSNKLLCETDADCPGGFYCDLEALECVFDCIYDLECPGDLKCTGRGRCECVETYDGLEVCDDQDNDCDGETDEECVVCDTHDHMSCEESELFWVDSCGFREDLISTCECGCNQDGTDCKTPCDCTPECAGKVCGPNGCGGLCPPGCDAEEACDEETGQCEECSPDCAGKECGPDGCGGTCAPGCDTGEACNEETGLCGPCTPDCTGKECGPDGCNGTCPPGCGDGERCNYQGQCECAPGTCADLGYDCGTWDNGCGNVLDCGGCPFGQACNDQGQCECDPDTCEGLGYDCGTWDDGCGNVLDCGECPAGETCSVWGWCECDPDTCAELGYECGTWENGCGGNINCGACAAGELCSDQGQCETGCTPATQIVGGAGHTCKLTGKGIAWCWGSDSFGQLGDGGGSVDSQVPVPVNVSGMTGETSFVQLAAGWAHTCGLSASGVAWCWGKDSVGQLGDGGVANDSQVPVQVNVGGITSETAFVQIVSGENHACGLLASGAAWCWGSDFHGQLGDGGGSTDSQVPVPVEVSGMAGENAFVQLAAGVHHTCGLLASGAVWCWGSDEYGQLGDGGASNDSQVPVQVNVAGMTGETAFVKILAGGYHTCGLVAPGVAWCWGSNLYGQLGDGTIGGYSQAPVEVSGMTGEAGFIQIAAGDNHTCGLTASGDAWCWGNDYSGQLGDGGGSVDSPVPVPVDVSSMAGETVFTELAAGNDHTCGLTASGDAWCWGDDTMGQLGDEGGSTNSQVPVPVHVLGMTGETDFVQLVGGKYNACGLVASGDAWCWGDDEKGQLGDGGISVDSRAPVAVDVSGMTGETGFIQVDFGRYHACGLVATGVAWCWGGDEFGQLGDGGTSSDSQVPVPVNASGMTGETAFVQLAVGEYHTCGLVASGAVWCWGKDGHGQLGNGGTSINSQVPVQVEVSGMTGDTAFVQIDAGDSHTCGLVTSGAAWCWGSDEYGQLGNGGSTGLSQVPVSVVTAGMTGDTAFVGLACGALHTCGLTASGAAWCWGRDTYGQLGDGGSSNNAQIPVPVDVAGMTGETAFVQITGGANHTCGLTASGAAWCWGTDGNGRLGNGPALGDSQVPVPVYDADMTGVTSFTLLAAGATHTCGLVASGVAWCWGQDLYGQLGNGGAPVDSQVPVLVSSPP